MRGYISARKIDEKKLAALVLKHRQVLVKVYEFFQDRDVSKKTRVLKDNGDCLYRYEHLPRKDVEYPAGVGNGGGHKSCFVRYSGSVQDTIEAMINYDQDSSYIVRTMLRFFVKDKSGKERPVSPRTVKKAKKDLKK